MEIVQQEKHTNQETEVPYSIHDKCLFGGVIKWLVFVPKTNQQIGTKPYTLPSDKHHHEIIAEHQEQHEEYKKIEIGEKLMEVIIIMHVSDRINMDQETYTSHYHQPDSGKLVYEDPKLYMHVTQTDPIVYFDINRFRSTDKAKEIDTGYNKGTKYHSWSDDTWYTFTQALPKQSVDQETYEGQ